MTEDETRIREAVLARIQADPEWHLRAYTAVFGNVLNADDAATLFEEYNADRLRRRVAVHPAAVWIRDELFRRALNQTASHRQRVVFTAGGNSAGKSSAITATRASVEAAAVLDSTFSNYAHARKLLDQALDHGKESMVLYVRRALPDAFTGMIARTRAEGRVVTIEQMIRSDGGAADTIRQLAADFAGVYGVGFWFVDNNTSAPRLAGIELAAPQEYTAR